MSPPKSDKTIDQIFAEFLAEQEARLSEATYRKYENIIEYLFRGHLERYRPGHNDQAGSAAITKAGGTYCGTYGAEDAVSGFTEFLGYYMPHKVIAGNETMKAAGTVIKKLEKWLGTKGYIEKTDAGGRRERVRVLARDLGASQKVLDMLEDWINSDDYPSPIRGKRIEGHFWIDRIEPGRLWLSEMLGEESDIGPIKVPQEISRACKEDWDIGCVVAKTGREWRFVEVWNISP